MESNLIRFKPKWTNEMISLRGEYLTFCLFCVKLCVHSKNCHLSGPVELFLLSIKQKFLCHHQKRLVRKNVQHPKS
jgi:hypothetical protein